MKVALPRKLWDELDKKTQDKIEKACIKTKQASTPTWLPYQLIPSGYYEKIELEIMGDFDYSDVNSAISEKLELIRLRKTEKEYNKLKSSVNNIKEVLK